MGGGGSGVGSGVGGGVGNGVGQGGAHVFEFLLQKGHHVFLDDDPLFVEVLDDEVVVFAVNVDDDGFDGRVALDEDAWRSGLAGGEGGGEWRDGPRIARGMVDG